jgi:hypothetical protein
MKNFARFATLLSFTLFGTLAVHAQGSNDWWKMSEKSSKSISKPVRSGPTPGEVALREEVKEVEPETTAEETRKLTKSDTLIPTDATVYVDEMGGFEHYVLAAMRKKSVPLIVVTDPKKADFIIIGESDTKRAGWAKMLFFGSRNSDEMAGITMFNRKTKVVVFADTSHRWSANRGKRSTAEKLAKYLGKKMKEDEKKLRQS